MKALYRCFIVYVKYNDTAHKEMYTYDIMFLYLTDNLGIALKIALRDT